jgi:integrase
VRRADYPNQLCEPADTYEVGAADGGFSSAEVNSREIIDGRRTGGQVPQPSGLAAVALALGLRQGEALVLRWADVDLDAGTLVVRRSRLRPKWLHGCAEPCGRRYPGYCPQRRPAREESVETKSRAGRRRIGLPDELVALLRKHRDEQDRERELAGQLWTEGGWVFTTPMGGPLNHRSDYDEWKRLLVRAGVRDGRLHDARHTAATVLLLLGVPERAVMGLMGWSHSAMAARYQHLTGAVQRDVARRVGGLLWCGNGGRDDG